MSSEHRAPAAGRCCSSPCARGALGWWPMPVLVDTMATVRQPDRARWSSPLGSVGVIRQQRLLIVGTRRVSPGEAAEYRDAITAALEWLGAIDPTVVVLDDLDDGAIPEPCRVENARGICCRLDEGHDAPHQFYAHVGDDPWAVAVPAGQLGDFTD